MAKLKEPYTSIAVEVYGSRIPNVNRIQNADLRLYFDECFERIIDHFGIYPCWVCIDCMARGTVAYDWGKNPSRCPNCDSRRTFQVGTFNSWASRVGTMFGAATNHLLREAFEMPIHETPGNTTTHDFEVSSHVAIEAKGSPRRVRNPNGTVYELKRPGMSRTDTRKKAFANAGTFKRRNPNAYFGIVTNSLPSNLLNYHNDVVNRVVNLTRLEEIEVLIRDLGEHVDLEALRRREFG